MDFSLKIDAERVSCTKDVFLELRKFGCQTLRRERVQTPVCPGSTDASNQCQSCWPWSDVPCGCLAPIYGVVKGSKVRRLAESV